MRPAPRHRQSSQKQLCRRSAPAHVPERTRTGPNRRKRSKLSETHRVLLPTCGLSEVRFSRSPPGALHQVRRRAAASARARPRGGQMEIVATRRPRRAPGSRGRCTRSAMLRHDHLDHRDLAARRLVADRVHHVGGLQRQQPRLLDLDARFGDVARESCPARRAACRTRRAP